VSVGTIEGLLVGGDFYFLEMNTRLQVEHPVTELVTGIDLVRTQIEIAQGKAMTWSQQDIEFRGCAIECRINAEDAAKGFLPRPGTISTYREPAGPGVRVDSGVQAGSVVSAYYDPLVAKLIVWDVDRVSATQRMLRALSEFEISGIKTLVPFHRAFLSNPEWAAGGTGQALLADKAFLSAIDAGGQSAPAPAPSLTVV
jgi:acetyl/propionyl-CoA carboxylase alpha subunit